MKIRILLLVASLLVGCTTSPNNGTTWTSHAVNVKLIQVDERALATSEFDQYYKIQFADNGSIYEIPSVLSRSEVAESFARTSQSFGASSIHFSSSGRTFVIKDDTPGAASSDGHKLIIGTNLIGHRVVTVVGPERPGILIEDWPSVASITDKDIQFRYDGEEKTFSIALDALLLNAKEVE